MLKVTMLALGASFSIAAMMPQDASAQLSGRERTGQSGRAPTGVYRGDDRVVRSDDRCYDDDDRWDRDGRDDRPNRPHDNGKHKGWYKNGKNGKHDKHDRDDCYNGRRDDSASRIGDIILRRPRYDQRALSYGTLEQILGRNTLQRIDQARYQLGYNGQLTGRWYDVSGGSQLDLFANGRQIAQILDRNRDGRADVFRWTNAR